MPTALTSSKNDSYQVSVYKMAYNFWAWATANGYVGSAPNPSCSPSFLLSQAVDYSAFLA